MRNTKIYSILEEFDKYEQNRCRKFLQSPYFNRDQSIVDLFDLLVSSINAKSTEELEKEKIWKKLKKDAPYDDVRFRKYFSDLLKLIQDYLSQQVYEDKPVSKAIHFMEAVGKRKLERLQAESTRNVTRLSQQVILRSSEFYLDQYLFEKNYYELNKHDRTSKTNIESINENLDSFYISEKLRYYCLVLGQQKVASHAYHVSFINEIIEFVKNNNYDKVPSIAVYYQILLVENDGENSEHYFKLKQLLEKNGLKFPREEAESMYGFAFNYCVSKINKGEQIYQNELFDIYKDQIEKGIIIVDGELSPWDFRNITTIALRLGEYNWVESFIKDFQHFLPDAFRQNAVNYNLAQIYFYQKRYDDVKKLLQEVEFEDFTYNLGSKSMLLAIYYETDEIEPLYSLFESFRTYLNRHKDIPQSRRQNYANLIKFTKKLAKALPNDKKSVEKLRQELESTKNVASYAWLIEKITELES